MAATRRSSDRQLEVRSRISLEGLLSFLALDWASAHLLDRDGGTHVVCNAYKCCIRGLSDHSWETLELPSNYCVITAAGTKDKRVIHWVSMPHELISSAKL